MIVLGIDTCGKQGGVALVRAEAGAYTLLAEASLAGKTYSAQLVPQLASVLEQAGVTKGGIDLYVVASGPGSFTGLRVGIATVKALAEVFGRPVAEVSVLEAMASAAGGSGRVLALLDAQRNEVYAGEYELGGALPGMVREVLLPQEALIDELRAKPVRMVSCDETVLTVLADASVMAEKVERPAARNFAELGARKFAAGITVAPELLDANYIRRSDAEIFSAPRLGIQGEAPHAVILPNGTSAAPQPPANYLSEKK